MSQALTPGQHALLENALVQKQQRLEQSLQAQLGGQDRVTHAREQLLQDADDAREHDAEREVDLARSDRNLEALREVNEALLRLRSPDYGLCIDCGKGIAFDRLQHSPEVLRCIDCQSALEKSSGSVTHRRI
ncbi:TraR/DksA family transcriptional regulator [Roseateles sp.]|jgi:DnaK suppressor protein|uniref:TraR/DksA family transcriptional regulator n=1 Tax=Roseateles sp. TaxID=1971397 RepID=UPI0037C58C58